ncbi:MAG TPA: MFS transporter [Micromonosporaceae bacterium]|nr:MFS transporter [Micromonosporaceae bacterium]
MSFTSTSRPAGAEQAATGATAPPPHPPRWGDVYLSSAARAVSTGGDFLAATALVLALQSRGAGGVAVAAVLLASTVPMTVLAPLAGRLADRVDSRVLLVGTGLVQAAVCAVLAYSTSAVVIVALVAVLAAGLAVTQPTLGALVPDMVGRAHLPRAMAVSQTAFGLGALAGPALAGVLVGQFGVRVPLLIDAVTYLAIAVAGLLIRTRRGGRAAVVPAAAGGGPPAPAWRLRSDRLLLALLLAVVAAVAAISAVNVIDVFFVRETLGGSTTMYGVLGGVWTGSMLAGSWLTAGTARDRDDLALARGMLGLLASMSAVLLVAALVPDVWWLVPLWLVGGVINGGENLVAGVVVARRVPAEVRGRALGTFAGAVNAANMVGYAAGGALLALYQPRPLVAACGVAGLVVVAACVVPVARAERRQAPVAPVTAGAAAGPPAVG